MQILNQAQAKAVYEAIVAINNVGLPTKLEFVDHMNNDRLEIAFLGSGELVVKISSTGRANDYELHESQAEFALCYNIG